MLVTEPKALINRWIAEQGGGRCWPESYTALGWVQDGDLIGAVCYYDVIPGRNVMMNIALSDGRFPIGLLDACLAYPFEQLGLPRLTFIVEEDNLASQNLVTKLGAVEEGRLRNAGKSGDLIVFVLWRENAELWRKLNEQRRRRTGPPGLHGPDEPAGADQSGHFQPAITGEPV